MKKLGIILLALTMVMMTFLSGCQSQPQQQSSSSTSSSSSVSQPNKIQLDPANPIPLEIWHYYNGPQKTAFDALVLEFNETVGMEQGIAVDAFSQGNVSELIQKVIDSANKKVGASEVPDIFAAYADTAYAVDQLGLVASLDQYMTAEELASYREEFLDEGRFDAEGNLKIFPIAKSTELMMINRTDWDKFSDATGVQLSELETIEGVTKAAKAYYEWTDGLTPDVKNDGKALFGRDALANYMVIGTRQLGVEIFSGTGDQVTINADKAALRKLWDNYYIPYINGHFLASGKFRSDDAKTGEIISLVGSSSGALYFPDEVSINDKAGYPIECEILPAPCFAEGEKFAVQQGAGMVVTKSDEKTEYAATVFLKWFTEASRNIEFAVGSGYLPVKNDALNLERINAAIEKTTAPEKVEKTKQIFSAALDQFASDKLYTSKAFSGGTKARNVLESAINDYCAQDRQMVINALKEGTSLEEATKTFASDAYFDTWYEKLVTELNKTLS